MALSEDEGGTEMRGVDAWGEISCSAVAETEVLFVMTTEWPACFRRGMVSMGLEFRGRLGLLLRGADCLKQGVFPEEDV